MSFILLSSLIRIFIKSINILLILYLFMLMNFNIFFSKKILNQFNT